MLRTTPEAARYLQAKGQYDPLIRLLRNSIDPQTGKCDSLHPDYIKAEKWAREAERRVRDMFKGS